MSKGPEADLQEKVLALARIYGWHRHHQRAGYQPGTGRWVTGISGEAGFPDLVLVRGDRLIFAELKSQRGRVSATQEIWLGLLRTVPGVEVYVWKPEDMRAGTIQSILERDRSTV